MRHPLKPPANPGASGTATVYDSDPNGLPADGTGKVTGDCERVSVAVFTNVGDATLFCKWQAPGSSSLRTFNGGGLGEVIPANTFFQRDVLMMPGRNQITIVTVTGPTTWEVGAERIAGRALAQ